jgi:hypothetical protein
VRNELQTRQKIKLSVHQLLLLIFFSLVFGALGFLYSFIGFFDHQRENINSLDLFNELTIQEIGGHFLFGFIVSIPLKNVKISILTGLMALTIDSDHLLNSNEHYYSQNPLQSDKFKSYCLVIIREHIRTSDNNI